MDYERLHFLEPREYYDHAIIGITENNDSKAVYSFTKLIEQVSKCLDLEISDALDYYYHNISDSNLIVIIFDDEDNMEALMTETNSPIVNQRKPIESLSKNKSMAVEIRFYNTKMNFVASETTPLITASVLSHMPKCVQIVYALNESKSSFDLFRIDSGQYTFVYKYKMTFSGALAQMGEDISKGIVSFIESDNKELIPYELEPCGFSIELNK